MISKGALVNSEWYFPLDYPLSCPSVGAIGFSLPIDPLTSGYLNVGYAIGGYTWIPFLKSGGNNPGLITSDNADEYSFYLWSRIDYFSTADISPLSYGQEIHRSDWSTIDLPLQPIDLSGMLNGNDHHCGMLWVEGEDDSYIFYGFESAEFHLSIPLSGLPSNCLFSVTFGLACYEKSAGDELALDVDFFSPCDGVGLSENGTAIMGSFEDLYNPSEGFVPIPYQGSE